MYTNIFLSRPSYAMRLLFPAFLFLLCFYCSSAIAQGNLMITPRRVLFEDNKKTQELNLANTGKDTARYLISMIEIRMKEDGTFQQISVPDSGQYFASPYIRFFPRSVVLGPGEVQTVKVQVFKQVADGEYRSHIYFRAAADEAPLGEQQPTGGDSTNISVRLKPVFGISIPVIIRKGESASEVALSDASFEKTKDGIPVLSAVFNRKGNMSVYGDVFVNFISPEGKKTLVAKIKGIAVYTPTLSRKIKLALDKDSGIDYKTGKLHIDYMTSEAKPTRIAETELDLM